MLIHQQKSCVAMLRNPTRAYDLTKWKAQKCETTLPYLCQTKKGTFMIHATLTI